MHPAAVTMNPLSIVHPINTVEYLESRMAFQEVFLCSPRNAECLDSPPRVAAAPEAPISSTAAAAPGNENDEEEGQLMQVQVQPQTQHAHEEDGGLLRRSRARMKERAQFLKECEMMMIKTTRTKKNLLGTPPPPTASTTAANPGGSFAISNRMKKLWDFNDTAGDDVHNTLEIQQQRDDEDHEDGIDTNYYPNYYHYNNIQDNDDDDDDDDIDHLWPSTKIRRESRRAKLGMLTMREKQELSEVESFVAEMRRKRMVREEERQKNSLQEQERDDGWSKFDKMLINDEEKERKHDVDNVEQEHTRKIVPYVGINREDDDDLEEYTAIRTMEAVQNSPRDARLQRISKWKNANSTQYHQKSTITSTTLARRAPSASSYAIHNNTAEELGTMKEAYVKKGAHTRLTDSELKRWWNEHKRDNHIEHSMPSFEELVDEPTILEKRTQKQSPERELSTTSMRIEHLRNSRKGGRADHPPHPEDSTTTPNNNDRLAPSENASTSLLLPPPPPPKLSSSNIRSSIVTKHHHTIDDYDTMSHSTLAMLQSRLDEAKVKFAKVTAEGKKQSSPLLNRQKDVNNLEEQAALAELISRLGEAVVTMKKLDQV